MLQIYVYKCYFVSTVIANWTNYILLVIVPSSPGLITNSKCIILFLKEGDTGRSLQIQ